MHARRVVKVGGVMLFAAPPHLLGSVGAEPKRGREGGREGERERETEAERGGEREEERKRGRGRDREGRRVLRASLGVTMEWDTRRANK